MDVTKYEGHTPGPWQVCNLSDVFTPLGALSATGQRAADNDGWHIADCGRFPTSLADGGEAELSVKEEMANARLVAAAPDLLAALIAERKAVAELVEAAKESLSRCLICYGKGKVELAGVTYECDAAKCVRLRAALAPFPRDGGG